MAALLGPALGPLAGMGELAGAGGAGALLVLALSEKAAIHGAVARLGATELRAAMQFAVLALIVLPVLPNQAYGPLGGINPRTLWIVVLIFSGLNFAGFLAGPGAGGLGLDYYFNTRNGVIEGVAGYRRCAAPGNC